LTNSEHFIKIEEIYDRMWELKPSTLEGFMEGKMKTTAYNVPLTGLPHFPPRRGSSSQLKFGRTHCGQHGN
jgi:hypothetical protein